MKKTLKLENDDQTSDKWTGKWPPSLSDVATIEPQYDVIFFPVENGYMLLKNRFGPVGEVSCANEFM